MKRLLLAFLVIGTEVYSVPVLEYTFEAQTDGLAVTSVADQSGEGNTGIVSGQVFATSERFGIAGDFSGDSDYLSVADNPSLRPQKFTLELSFRPNDPYTLYGDNPSTLLTRQITSVGTFISNYNVNYDPVNDRITGQISWSAGSGLILTANGISETAWSSVALVLNRDVAGTDDFFGLYLNGALVDSVQQEIPTLGYTSGPLVIGAGNFGTPGGVFRRNFDGLLDNVRLSDEPLAPAQFIVPEPHAAAWLTLVAIGLGVRRRS